MYEFCQGGFIWVVIPQDSTHRCKSWSVKYLSCYNLFRNTRINLSSTAQLVVNISFIDPLVSFVVCFFPDRAQRSIASLAFGSYYEQSQSWGTRDGAVVRALASNQCDPGSNPGVDTICGLSLLLVPSFAPRGFSLGTPVFPSPQKPTFPNSNSARNQVDKEPLCGCAISKSLLTHLIT